MIGGGGRRSRRTSGSEAVSLLRCKITQCRTWARNESAFYKRTAWQGLDAAVCHSLFKFAESGYKSGYVFDPYLFFLSNLNLLGCFVC
jgi:hypothetical protein